MAFKLIYFPDKPVTSSPSRLRVWDKSRNFICQQKVDGFRILLEFTESGVKFISRHDKDFTKEIALPIMAEAERLSCLVPINSRLDGEWRSRRSCSVKLDLPQRIFIFDVFRWDAQWKLDIPYEQRWQMLQSIVRPATSDNPIVLSECAPDGGFEAFYELQKTVAWSEGVVVKHKQSKLVANRKRSEHNPGWYKCKYRSGVDGETIVDPKKK